MSAPQKFDAIVARYKQYASEWRAKGREREADAMEELVTLLENGAVKDPRTVAPPMDPRLPIIAQMAATIFTELVVYQSNQEARHHAIDHAFLLYGQIAIRLGENDR